MVLRFVRNNSYKYELFLTSRSTLLVSFEQDKNLVLNPVLIKIEDDLQEESTAGPSEPTVTSNQMAMSAFKPRKRKRNVTVDDYLGAGKNNPKARFKGGKDIILARMLILPLCC